MAEEIKVVVSLKGEGGFIGVQAPDCDPLITVFEGDLTVALERVLGLVEVARQRWAENSRYPKCPMPPPSQTEPNRPTQTSNRQITRPQGPQQSLF